MTRSAGIYEASTVQPTCRTKRHLTNAARYSLPSGSIQGSVSESRRRYAISHSGFFAEWTFSSREDDDHCRTRLLHSPSSSFNRFSIRSGFESANRVFETCRLLKNSRWPLNPPESMLVVAVLSFREERAWCNSNRTRRASRSCSIHTNWAKSCLMPRLWSLPKCIRYGNVEACNPSNRSLQLKHTPTCGGIGFSCIDWLKLTVLPLRHSEFDPATSGYVLAVSG